MKEVNREQRKRAKTILRRFYQVCRIAGFRANDLEGLIKGASVIASAPIPKPTTDKQQLKQNCIDECYFICNALNSLNDQRMKEILIETEINARENWLLMEQLHLANSSYYRLKNQAFYLFLKNYRGSLYLEQG